MTRARRIRAAIAAATGLLGPRRPPASPALALLLVALLPSALRLGTGRAAGEQPGESNLISVVSTDPASVHRVRPGATTTFVLRVGNPLPFTAFAIVTVTAQPADWAVRMSEAGATFAPTGLRTTSHTIPLAAGAESLLVVEMIPSPDVASGALGTATITAGVGDLPPQTVSLQAEVTLAPKIYLVAIDGLGPRYPNLDRRGGVTTWTERLMPNLVGFRAQAAYWPLARSPLPAATDMNLTALLSGSWPGTSGIPYVAYYFHGFDAGGSPVWSGPSHDMLRFGPQGEPVLSMFDIAKIQDAGRRTAMITGMRWVADVYRDEVRPVDLLVTGADRPSYLTAPMPYRLGDPISDPDAAADRDGINTFPLSSYKMQLSSWGRMGSLPLEYSEDRWVTGSALRLIAAEDPDVFLIHLANVDKAQHAAGAADRPEEWRDNGLPGVLWDDVNRFNAAVNRETVLDVVHEADACLGEILAALASRGVRDDSFIVVFSDHGNQTYMNGLLDADAILAAAGVPREAYFTAAAGEALQVFVKDPAWTEPAEQALEGFQVRHPVLGGTVRPLLVVNREEMLTGVDGVHGPVAENGGPHRGELYSEWHIEYPATDGSKLRWPDLDVFAMYRYQFRSALGAPAGGHSGPNTQQVLLALSGPGVRPGWRWSPGRLVDIAPTMYEALGWSAPGNVDGRALADVFDSPGRSRTSSTRAVPLATEP